GFSPALWVGSFGVIIAAPGPKVNALRAERKKMFQDVDTTSELWYSVDTDTMSEQIKGETTMKRTKGILGFVMAACLLGGLAGCGGQAASASAAPAQPASSSPASNAAADAASSEAAAAS